MKTTVQVCLISWLGLAALSAATFTVSNTNDSGPGSLRAALAAAVNGDTIDATSISGSITLTNGHLVVSHSVTITGPGPGSLSVNGNFPNTTNRVFYITNAVTVAISGLTITNGVTSGNFPIDLGAGIWNDHSTLTVSNCAISGNSVGGGIWNDGRLSGSATLSVRASTVSRNSGGGIYNDGDSSGSATLSVNASTISGNTGNNGGGIYTDGDSGGTAKVSIVASTISSNSAGSGNTVGGGIWNNGNLAGQATLSVSNCTFSGNSAGESGGGIYNGGVNGSGVVTVIASTFSGNSASAAGGAIFNNATSAKLEIGNTILNAGASGGTIVNNVGVISDGYNLCSDSGGGSLTNATDRINTEPLLGALAKNGGPTMTHALLPGSPAIDRGKSFGLAADQRGAPRPFDFASITNASGGDGSDIGALELGSPRLSIQRSSENVLLVWPAYYGEFTLESNTNLNTNVWAVVSPAPTVSGTNNVATNGVIGTEKYYHLRAP